MDYLHRCEVCGTELACEGQCGGQLTCCGQPMIEAPVDGKGMTETDELFFCSSCGREMTCVNACGIPFCCSKEMLRKAKAI